MSNVLKGLTLGLLALVLTACGSTTKMTGPETADWTEATGPRTFQVDIVNARIEGVPEPFIAGIRSHVKTEMENLSLHGVDGNSTHAVQIQITEYRMRGNATRFMFGVLAGKDGVTSNLKVYERASGSLAAEADVSTFNSTAVGGADMVAQMHGKAIAEFLSGKSAKQ